ncbi:udp-glycosyltransferase 88b1 [Quercus suber]|uniref:Udp-glycosyltransferase 88b1 n=1 Tax=Quercus suber TaxID=58331 RepID=A0AAW0L6T1_QUESU
MENAIVLYPFPGRGHLISMVELGKLILKHNPSFNITILIFNKPNTSTASTVPQYVASSTTQYITAVNSTTPSINFHHLPPISEVPSTPSRIAQAFLIPRLNNLNLHQALKTISQTSKLKAFIIDFLCDAAFEVATNLDISTYYFFPSGASALSWFLYIPTLHKKVEKSFKDLGDMLLDIPGLPPIRASDMPGSITDRTAEWYEYFLNTAAHMAKSNGIIVNTFDLLETKAVKAISDGLCVPDGPTPPIFCIGPLISSSNQDEDEHECLKWMNSQPSRSVVFLCFGSMGLFSAKQLEEMAVGLENSGQRFLWVEMEDGFVNAEELEKRVRELFESKAGREVRESVLGFRDEAMIAQKEGGSSHVAFAKLARGHLISMVELGKLILKHNPSFNITILIFNKPNTSTASTVPQYVASSTTQYITAVNSTTPSINFHHLPPISEVPSTPSRIAQAFLIPRLNNLNLHQALKTISQTSKLKAFIIDFLCDAAFEVATNLDISTYYFFPSGASALSWFLYIPTLHKKVEKSFKDLGDMLLDIPGLPPIRASDMPGSITDRTAEWYEYFLNTAAHMAKSNGIIVNTFDLLETKAVKAISDGLCVPDGPTPPIFCIGPLISSSNQDEDEHECLKWMNSQPSRSVVFLCFGSMGLFSAKQLEEMAVGLENSGQRFLWVEMEDGFVNAEELEKRVRELFESKAGREVRESVLGFRDEAMIAQKEGGSSHVAFAKLARLLEQT